MIADFRVNIGTVDGAKIRITITEPRTGSSFFFDNVSAGDATWAAKLLHDKIRDQFNARVKEMRQSAYEAGWKDAKARKAKRGWFSDCFNVVEPQP